MHKTSSHHSWREVLATPARASHILQLYDSDDFLAGAVAHFAAEGLKQGEAVLLSGTGAHLSAIHRALCGIGVDGHAVRRAGQLCVIDAEAALAPSAGELDLGGFEALAAAALERATGAPYTGLRWWGEITGILHQRGETRAGLAAEHAGNALAREHGATIFCSFLCDRYDARYYDDTLKELCCLHSHVIPAEDYARHRIAVNRAMTEVLGELRGSLLQSLASWKAPNCSLPSSQAALFWLRETLPEHFEAVLQRARVHHLKDRSLS